MEAFWSSELISRTVQGIGMGLIPSPALSVATASKLGCFGDLFYQASWHLLAKPKASRFGCRYRSSPTRM